MALERIVADAETFFDDDYSLTKLSTSEYLRDPRFECHGFSILRESEAFKPRFVRGPDLTNYFGTIDWSQVECIAHNGHFDFGILSEHYNVIPARYFCTQAAARYVHRGNIRHSVEDLARYYELQGKKDGLLDVKGKRIAAFTEADWAKLEPYAIHDAKLELYFYLKMAPLVTDDERELMDMFFRMWTQPMLEVDLGLAREALAEAEQKRSDKIDAGGIDLSILRSRNKFANLLRGMGIEPPMKKSKTTGKPTYAFARNDEDFIELLHHSDETVRNIVEAKLESSSNLPITRAQRVITMGETGPFIVALNYWGARPGRASGGNKMNTQNFVRGSKLRKAIRAPKDHVIAKADQSNIECRMNMWFWDQDDVLDIFRNKGDVYSDMATDIFGYPVNRKHKVLTANGEEFYPQFSEGFVGKTTELQLMYQSGPERLRHALATSKEAQIKLSLDECKRIVYEIYRVKRWKIAAGWQTCQEWLRFLASGTGQIQHKCITLDADERKVWGPDGTFLYYPALHQDESGDFIYKDQGGANWVYIYGGKFLENLIQWLSRVTMAANMREIGRRYRIVNQEHDSVFLCVPQADAPEALQFTLQAFRRTPLWAPGLSLDADGDIKPHLS